MQMKKQNWLRLRRARPCRICGKDHETRQCVARSGQVRKAAFLILFILFIRSPSVQAELTATVHPGYTFGPNERPTIATLNLAARPTVEVSGTLGGTNVGLAANSVSGAMLMTSVVDDSTVEFFDNSGATAIRVKASGITETNLATSVAGLGLGGGGSTALSNKVDGFTIAITNDTLTLSSNVPLAYVKCASNTIPYGHYTGYLTNLPPSQFYTNLVAQVTSTTTNALLSVITAGGIVVEVAHGFAAPPTILRAELICTSADSGYAAGDRLDLGYPHNLSSTSPGNVWCNATNMGYTAYGSAANWQIYNKSTGASSSPAVSKWVLRVVARP